MKKIIYSFWALLLGVTLYSCDMDIDPTNSVNSELVFENADNADKVLNGTWSYLFDTYFTYQNPGWTSVLLASDAMGSDIAIQPGKYGYIGHYEFSTMSSTSTTSVTAAWTLAYKTIDNMNNIIARIDGVEGKPETKARVKAQALALRGYIYLNMASFYALSYEKDPAALCVPIYTEPSSILTEGKPKSQLKDVFKRAEDDLTEAYKTIGDYNRSGLKYKIDKNVIAGLLARLYLQTSNWAEAQSYAEKAQSSYSWMATASYLQGFNDLGNAEWIWGHGQTTEQNTASYSFQYKDVSSKSSGYYSFLADPYFKDFFDQNDIRYQLFEWDLSRYKGALMYKKFLLRSDETADIVLMRKAEMVLIEAEAYAEQDKLPLAIAKLNELRSARNADKPNLSGLNKKDLIEVILIERRKELFGEGFSLSDIIRRQKAVERKAVPNNTALVIDGKPVEVGGEAVYIKGHTITKFPSGDAFAPNSTYYLFAIPASETTNNPNL
ncbi:MULTISPECIES: RagB/SusD family nutrient uptake outer membrane protein [unclassified Dysgonomonas]|uniref:RagB/SusD family nutrient uptake outer membrane protein n=1 Tax=unclassified Dysgonomonas TaxID=2630389 RepID=UPI0013EAFED1|nr:MULTISPECIES: RagB/SusD family nutrient uptake outer membrane protein [unclassified Dysgonomonas]